MLILLPILILLAAMGLTYAKATIDEPPRLLIATLFCFFQIALYIYALFDDIKIKLVSAGIVIIAVLYLVFGSGRPSYSIETELPDKPKLSSSATVSLKDTSFGSVGFISDDRENIDFDLNKLGKTELIVEDGKSVYIYSLNAYTNENGGFCMDLKRK